MQNPMYGMPNYSFQSPFGNGMNTSYQNQQLPHYDIVKVNGRNGAEAFQMGPNSPAYGVTSSGVAGTVTHVAGYAAKLD